MLFQIGKDQVFFAAVVLVDGEQRADLGQESLGRERAGRDTAEQRADALVNLPLDGGVLRFERMRRMPGDLACVRGGVDLLNAALKHAGVHVAEALHLAHGEAFGDERLLRRGDFAGGDAVKRRAKLALNLLNGLSLVQLAQHILDGLFSHFTIVDFLTHIIASCSAVVSLFVNCAVSARIQRGNDGFQRDALERRALNRGHEASRTLQHTGLGDVRKPQLAEDGQQFGMRRTQRKDRVVQIDRCLLHTLISPPVSLSDLSIMRQTK
ncbi:hypothetical protein SDC9_149801 [bioreactor metagenome]|uniref:Uncharacterized protein n=1 Tax=bioreactor metagenome TaxID=1076179 RepID=A0A645EKM4_9ZZZZ